MIHGSLQITKRRRRPARRSTTAPEFVEDLGAVPILGEAYDGSVELCDTCLRQLCRENPQRHCDACDAPICKECAMDHLRRGHPQEEVAHG